MGIKCQKCTANSKVHVKRLALDFELTGLAWHFLLSNPILKLFFTRWQETNKDCHVWLIQLHLLSQLFPPVFQGFKFLNIIKLLPPCNLLTTPAHRVRIISKANCKMGIGLPLKFVCTNWNNCQLRNFKYFQPETNFKFEGLQKRANALQVALEQILAVCHGQSSVQNFQTCQI